MHFTYFFKHEIQQKCKFYHSLYTLWRKVLHFDQVWAQKSTNSYTLATIFVRLKVTFCMLPIFKHRIQQTCTCLRQSLHSLKQNSTFYSLLSAKYDKCWKFMAIHANR